MRSAATSLHNVRYLTGFTGSNGAVLLFRDRQAILFTDPRYTVQSARQVNCEVRIAKGTLDAIRMKSPARGARHIGFEQDHLTVAQLEAFKKELPTRAELKATSGLIERLRMVKDAGEIERIRASCISNSRALETALKHFRPGMRESELAAEIDYRNRKLGAEAPAFDTIVAAGERSSLPHAHPGPAKIGPGILLIDMGAFRDGYASDMTRMVHIGPATPKYKRAYRAVLEAQLAAIDCRETGRDHHCVRRPAPHRATLKKHGLDKRVRPLHRPRPRPRNPRSPASRAQRQDETRGSRALAITIEPGVYIEGWETESGHRRHSAGHEPGLRNPDTHPEGASGDRRKG